MFTVSFIFFQHQMSAYK